MSPEQELQAAALKAREILPQLLLEHERVARDLSSREQTIKAMRAIIYAAETMTQSKKEA